VSAAKRGADSQENHLVRSRFDTVIAIASMAAAGSVFGFLGGVIADTEAVVVPIAAIAFSLVGAGFVWPRLAPIPRIISSKN
jgi:hypothetical protein